MKIKSFVGLNGSGDSYNLAEDKLPNENDEIYFTLENTLYDEYYKGFYKNNYFCSLGNSYSIEEVHGWCLVSDPTALQRLIFYIDLDFYFDAADWERTIVDNKVYESYPNQPAAVNIEELGLSFELETLLKEYVEFAYYPDLRKKDTVTIHNIDQLGLFIYEELRKELADKCYLVFYPCSDLELSFRNTMFEENNEIDFPMLIDNNEGNFSWVNPNVKLPELGKEVYIQLDSFTGEFKRGWLEKCGDNYFIRYKGIEYLDINRICRWQYTNE